MTATLRKKPGPRRRGRAVSVSDIRTDPLFVEHRQFAQQYGLMAAWTEALGGAGYTKEWPVERLVRDAKLYDIGAGTNEIRRFLIGRELLGG